MQVRAVQVDHIKSIRSGGAPFEHGNLCSLCATHHSQKTILVDGKHKGSGKQLVITGPDGFPIGPEKGLYGKEVEREKAKQKGSEDSSKHTR
jgi:hypothetical protein